MAATTKPRPGDDGEMSGSDANRRALLSEYGSGDDGPYARACVHGYCKEAREAEEEDES